MQRPVLKLICAFAICSHSMCLSNYPADNGNWALGFLLAGILTPATPFEGARISRTTAQSVPNSGVHSVQFQTEDFDTANLHSPALPDHITTATSGFYFLSGAVEFQTDSNNRRLAQLQGTSDLLQNNSSGVIGRPAANHVSVIQEFPTGTNLSLRTSQNSGGPLNTTAQPTTNLSIAYLDRAVASAAIATKSVPQNIPHAAFTIVNFEGEEYDTGNYFNLAQPDRFVIPETGVYLISANFAFPGASGPAGGVELLLNGSTAIARDLRTRPPGIGSSQSVSTVYRLNAGDFVSTRVIQTSGGGLNLNIDTRMSIARLDSSTSSARNLLIRALPTGTPDLVTGFNAQLILTDVKRADSAYSATDPTRTTVLETGLYLIIANAKLSANGNNIRRITLKRNGVNVQRTTTDSLPGAPATLNLISLRQLNAGDAVSLEVNQDSGASLTWTPERTFLQMVKMD